MLVSVTIGGGVDVMVFVTIGKDVEVKAISGELTIFCVGTGVGCGGLFMPLNKKIAPTHKTEMKNNPITKAGTLEGVGDGRDGFSFGDAGV